MSPESAAVRAVYAAFVVNGFAFASWASRIPQVKAQLELSAAELGFVLFAIAVGSVVGLPLSGPIIHRFGSRRCVAVGSALSGTALVGVALSLDVGVIPVVLGLVLTGYGMASWDVAMNVQGALVEQRIGRAIMPRFHAGFSFGTVGGALGGVAMVALDVPVSVHLAVVGAAVAVGLPLAVRAFLPDREDEDEAPSYGFRAWKEPRTLLVGVFVLAFAFAEGAGNDWIGVALIEDHGAADAIGTLGLAAFLTAMTAVRWVGPGLLERHGRVKIVRGLAVLSVIGLGLFCFGPSTGVAIAGAVLWGAGLALGFPVGMSAGADDPALAAARVSVVSSIAYCAFLAGPPLLGVLGEHSSVSRALIAVIALLGLAALIAGAVRPLATSSTTPR
ncbi:MFS transporter [Solirubrobacter sp. CPCC 204708]|uniref:MFS transporter n=1 Tax=Solirubrobacter deserti TaxID=2282478 RepID=A0ABT4RCZ6_9ACTN|nr:MFS transporter [Solirubrobacter deserti]MBE2315586.1 MFS transporter [Solirubrobacter deserti]MDA0136225.1 MFS transporter [Solirubrobacter deserti]